MKALIVTAHPAEKSLNTHLANTVERTLLAAGHNTNVLNLAKSSFQPCLTQQEREAYYASIDITEDISTEAQLLQEAEILVLVFPVWWFGPPALMKGFIDRVFAPGIAFEHSADFGPLIPKLTHLRHAACVCTFGSPWWIDRFVMGRPVRNMFRWGVFKACAPQANFQWFALYKAENPEPQRLGVFEEKLERYCNSLQM